MLEIYVDGSCSGNGAVFNQGGIGIVVTENNQVIEQYNQNYINTSNNRMELLAIIYVMEKYGFQDPVVYSDSSYAVNTLTDWMFRWVDNNWTKADGSTPENLDLIKHYYALYTKGFHIDLKKIPGHSGIKFNELADKLAKTRDNLWKEVQFYDG